MDGFSNDSARLEKKRKQLKELDEAILARKKELEELNKRIQQDRVDLSEYNKAWDETEDLEEAWKRFYRRLCKHRQIFEDKNLNGISNQKFHFFMCFRGNYYANPENPDAGLKNSVIEAHQEVIDKFGVCWWAKFFRQRIEDGSYERLEPLGESIPVDDFNNFAFKLREKVLERVNIGEQVYLFNYSPNPPHIELYLCNLIDFYFGRETIPYKDKEGRIPPECAYFPSYYFHKRKTDCRPCKKIDADQCILRFPSNFWFKIKKIEKMENPQKEFTKLINCFTEDTINLAIPILYPLLVYQKYETASPAIVLKEKGFKSVHLITDKQSSVKRVVEWLETEELPITYDIVKYTEMMKFAQGLSKRNYIADILLYEWGHQRHLKDFVESLSGKYKEKCGGRTITNIIENLKEWIKVSDRS